MKKFELNLFKDQSALKTLSILSIVITIISVVPFYALERLFSSQSAFYHNMSFSSIFFSALVVIVGSAAIIILHEGIHGIFFKLFNMNGKVKYGYKNGMFYATAPGKIYKKKYFSIIVIMPFIIITIMLILVLYLLDKTAITVILVFHTGACAGDFYYLYLMFKYKHLKYVEDTETGMVMFERRPGRENN